MIDKNYTFETADNKFNLLPNNIYDILEKYFINTHIYNYLSQEDNLYDYLRTIIDEYIIVNWLKPLKQLDLNIMNIKTCHFHYVHKYEYKYPYFHIYINYNIKVKENFEKLLNYKFNEEYYKNYEQFTKTFNVNPFNLKSYINETSIDLNPIITSKFLNYLIQDKYQYHLNNNTFEEFLKNYKPEPKHEKFYKKNT